MTRDPIVSEINFLPVRSRQGLVGVVSFVYRREFFMGNIWVFTRMPINGEPAYRLSYPEDAEKRKSYFRPINKQTQQRIEQTVSRFIEHKLISVSHGSPNKGGSNG